MLGFKEYITEARKGGYDDEHATVNLWNHVVGHKKSEDLISDHKKISAEIERAKKDPKHPLSFENSSSEGFKGGKKTEESREAYYRELHHAVHTVHGLANHPSIRGAVKSRVRAKVTGKDRGQLSNTWKAAKASDRTSKADIVIGEAGSKHHHPISLKKGDSQLMSAQGNEHHATMDHATNELMKSNKKFTRKHKEGVMNRVKQVNDRLSKMAKTTDKDKQRKLRDEAQKISDSIHDEHPDLLKHVHHEASTGHGKFGTGQTGTARHLVTSLPSGVHIHDTHTNNEPIVAGRPRIALPKGDGRPGNVKIDYKAIKKK